MCTLSLIYNDVGITKDSICGSCGFQINSHGQNMCQSKSNCSLNGQWEEAYETLVSDILFKELINEVTLRVMWDDHEFWDNYDQGPDTILFQQARKFFLKYMGQYLGKPVDKGVMYYILPLGEHAEAFVLDTRSYRDFEHSESEGKTMLGKAQMKHLKDWLKSSEKTWKIIISSTTFALNTATATYKGVPYLDGWAQYQEERTDLFDFIQKQNIQGVLLLTSDSHSAGLYEYELNGKSLIEITASPLLAIPLNGMDKTSPHETIHYQRDNILSVFASLDIEEDRIDIKYFIDSDSRYVVDYTATLTKSGLNEPIHDEL